ncbi:MAG: septal ring lytic transglycosylase RlpA family protein [Acidobacteriota bacterium]
MSASRRPIPLGFPSVILILAGFALVSLAACGGRSPLRAGPPVPVGLARTGIASWYGPKFQGRLTASGERYDMLDLTAAHRTLPFNTYVRVTNLTNSRSLVVRINDRGPFVRGRIIDLSFASAKILGISHAGLAKVRIRVMDSSEGARIHALQRGFLSSRGIRTWSDKDYEQLESITHGG